MPTYTFRNRADGSTISKRLSFAEYEQIRAGKLEARDGNGIELDLVFEPGSLGFVLKDGESGGWASKAGKERKMRAKRSERMARRERDHVFKPKLIPNYNGAEAPSWRDAQEAARSEKGNEAARSYDHFVTKERGGPR